MNEKCGQQIYNQQASHQRLKRRENTDEMNDALHPIAHVPSVLPLSLCHNSTTRSGGAPEENTQREEKERDRETQREICLWFSGSSMASAIRFGGCGAPMDVERSSLCNCVVNFLLEENYLLTAFELLHELLDDGRDDQAIRLKDFFADSSQFPPDQISRFNSLRGS